MELEDKIVKRLPGLLRAVEAMNLQGVVRECGIDLSDEAIREYANSVPEGDEERVGFRAAPNLEFAFRRHQAQSGDEIETLIFEEEDYKAALGFKAMGDDDGFVLGVLRELARAYLKVVANSEVKEGIALHLTNIPERDDGGAEDCYYAAALLSNLSLTVDASTPGGTYLDVALSDVGTAVLRTAAED